MKPSKKILSLLLVVLITALLLPKTAMAMVGGIFSVDGIAYSVLTESGTTGTVEVIANSYSGNITIPGTVVNGGITYTVTAIVDWAFEGCSGLTSISIPDGVNSIGNFAFYGCSSLTSISIPDGVTSIGNSAFSGCRSLTSISIPDGVISIGDQAFRDCSSLTSISIPDGVTSIGNAVFLFCSSLTSISIPDSVISIGGTAFSGCSSLTSISIPDGVTSIGANAFYGCSNLTSISIPDGVISIGNSTFSGCSSLTSISIPDGVTSIGNTAFSGCSSLTSISIPDGVTSIGGAAFNNCSGLTSMSIPNGVVSIGSDAFAHCSGLTSINIPDGLVSIGNRAFNGCSSLTSISIPDGVISIGTLTFSGCSSLTSISIPDGVTSIGANAFSGCSSLTSISIPHGVTFIGNNAFAYCSGLTSIVFSGSGPPTFGSDVFYNATAGLQVFVPQGELSAYETALFGKIPFNAVLKEMESVDAAAILGVSAPVRGAIPVTTITETAQYAGTVAWTPASSLFAANTVYTATITLTPKVGYTLTGVTENFFTVLGAASVSNAANSGVITAAFRATGRGYEEPATIFRTLTDSATGITASGSGISTGAQFTASPLVLHAAGDAACDAMRAARANGQLILGYEIGLSHGFTGPLTLTIPVPNEYNGQTVTILHCKNGILEMLTATVVNGQAVFTVTSLSPFAVVMGTGEATGLEPIPQTGDATSPLSLAIAGLAVICAAAYAVLKRRKACKHRVL